MIDLDKLEELARAATPGEWHRSDRPAGPFWHIYADHTVGGKPCINGKQSIGSMHAENRRTGSKAYAAMFEANASFVAAANPATILELIAEVRRLRAELNDFISGYGDLNQEVLGLRAENAVCRNAIEDAVDMVDACASTYDDDGSQGALRATKRQLSEAIGNACPRLMMEKPDGQKFYGLHWREMREERDRLRAFHDFFRDRCEGLFAQFGMDAIDAYNAAARGAE
ncbi:ead/Ea22-like family protein [Paraburkholderia tropica]|uniref:ead/Ea22-like family protein n=1 Tax=Paraburkholderia tropica TaxID=92647 RepID=UPI003D2C75BA